MSERSLTPLGTPIGTEVHGIDLSSALEEADIAWIGQALTDHAVLVFRDQHLEAGQIAALGRRFGRPEPHRLIQYRHPDFPEVSYITNVDAAGNIDKFGVTRAQAWHTDQSYDEHLPWFTLLHALEIPKVRGGTMYADMRAAYDALDNGTRERLAGLVRTLGPRGRSSRQHSVNGKPRTTNVETRSSARIPP
jgi:taurine dioxygenase